MSLTLVPSLRGERRGCPLSVTSCYGGVVELGQTQLGSVSSFAVRIAHFAGSIAEAHRLGHGPGRSWKPWGIGFQRRASSIYAQTLRAEYLRGVADTSGYCAGLMDGEVPEDGIAGDWWIVAEFLRSTSEALREMPSVAEVAYGVGAAEIGSTSPAVLRYELFAELLDSKGVKQLGDAAKVVALCCESHLQMVPTAQELEWLLSVAAQEPIDVLAERNNTSTRGMYRLLEAMWKRLGVRNQVQGVALAVQMGWIASPPHDGSRR